MNDDKTIEIPLVKRVVYAGDVMQSLIENEGWEIMRAVAFVRALQSVNAE